MLNFYMSIVFTAKKNVKRTISVFVLSTFLLLQILPYFPVSIQNIPLVRSILKKTSLLQPVEVDAAGLSSASATLSNPRLSFEAGVSTDYSAGTTVITISGSGNSDLTTAHLFPNDVVGIGSSSVQNPNLRVNNIVDTTRFILKDSLVNAVTSSDKIVATQSGSLTVSFYTSSAIPTSGSIKLSIPASAGTFSGSANDGIPDSAASTAANGFDFNGMTGANITCPAGFTAGTITPTTTGGSPHSVTCNWDGGDELPAGANLTVVVGNPGVAGGKGLVNPAPITSGHTAADVYSLTTATYSGTSGGGSLIESVIVKAAPIEGVLVSANIDETLTFTVAGIDSDDITTTCGGVISPIGTNVSSTATSVPFGAVLPGGFYNAAQLLTVGTNAPGGYTVKIEESDQMGKDGNACVGAAAGESVNCIKDTVCDAACDESTIGKWQTNTNKGLGYTLADVSGGHTSFNYTDVTGNCVGNVLTNGGGFCAKQLADREASEGKQTILQYAAPASADSACSVFRMAIAASQPSGTYFNTIKYTATALF